MASQKTQIARHASNELLALSMSSKLILLVNETDGYAHDESVEEVVSACLNYIAGWNVVSTSFMDERLEPLLTRQPDAILFNALLSRTCELSLGQKQIILSLKQNLLTHLSPVLLLIDTAAWLTSHELQGLGISGAIAKPFDPTSLVMQINHILGWFKE